MAKVTMVGTEVVKPTGDATGGGVLFLSAWDQVHSYSAHNQTVHFYRPPAAGMVEALRESLGRALAHFYPVAGRLRWAEARGRLEVDCNAKGAVLVEAEADRDLAFFHADLPPEEMTRLLLAPVVDAESTPLEDLPLLHVQVTRLRCGGAALGIALCHILTDGPSAFHFFSEWARLARGEPLKEAPYLDRKLLSRPDNEGCRRQLSFADHREFAPSPVLLGKKSSSEERSKVTTLKLSLTEAQIHALKAATAKSRAIHNGHSRPYTRYEVVTAHMWRCACKARGNEEEQPTTVYIGFGVRNRTKNVSIPPRYFGNVVFKINAISKAGELVANPLGFACSKIRESISKVDEDYIWSNFEWLDRKEDLTFYGSGRDKRVKSYARESTLRFENPNLRVGSWLTLPIYDMDFGWGNPVSMRPLGLDSDGISYLLPKPNDDRSIEVILCLQVAHADNFKKYFYEDISI